MTDSKREIIVAVTGASGSVYARKLIDRLCSLKQPPSEVAVVFSDTAMDIWKHEIGSPFEPHPPAKSYENNNFFSPFASGSSAFDTKIICPSSMGTLGRIAGGISDNLICRAADVMLKERRRLIIVPRETPYNLIHIRNMEMLTQAGAIICPASPSFYSKPATIADLVMTVVDRVLTLAGFVEDSYHWMEDD